MAQQAAQMAIAFEEQRTDHAPLAVTAVLRVDTLVIALHGALTPAEHALAASPAGTAQVAERHRQLFAGSSESRRQGIKRITGVDVREAAAEVGAATDTVVHAFSSGTIVQMFQLAQNISAEIWKGNGRGKKP